MVGGESEEKVCDSCNDKSFHEITWKFNFMKFSTSSAARTRHKPDDDDDLS